jgi:hypothetical protein
MRYKIFYTEYTSFAREEITHAAGTVDGIENMKPQIRKLFIAGISGMDE